MTAIWYPGCTVRFGVRFEDFLPGAPEIEDPAALAEAARRAALPEGLIAENPRGYTGPESALEPPRGDTETLPGVGAFKNLGFDIVPFSCSVELNSHREADRVRMTVPLRRFPFDPRIIRAATVRVYGGVHRPDEWARAMGADDGTTMLLGPTTKFGGREVSNELFRGFADEWEITVDGHDTLQITARDLTGWMIDAELMVNPLDDIPKTATLDQVIRLIIAGDGKGLPPALAPASGWNLGERVPGISRRFGLPGMRGLRVVNEATEVNSAGERAPLPAIGDFLPPNWFNSRKTAKAARKRPGKAQKMSYWDMITDLCVSAGFICYIRQSREAVDIPGLGASRVPELVISTPRTYYAQPPTRFEDGDSLVVERDDVRQYWYGQNTNSIRLRRKLTGINVPGGIEVRAWDSRRGLQLVGRYPPTPSNHAPAPSGKGSRVEYREFIARGVGGPRGQEIVDGVARSIYEQLGRGETEVRIETRHLAALPENLELAGHPGEVNVPADVFQLRPADPLTIGIMPEAVPEGGVSALQSFAGKSFKAIAATLLDGGFPGGVAAAVATALERGRLQAEYRTKRVIYNWSHDSGWEAAIDAINYLDVRNATDIIDRASPRQPSEIEEALGA